jgi:hypothetical protein
MLVHQCVPTNIFHMHNLNPSLLCRMVNLQFISCLLIALVVPAVGFGPFKAPDIDLFKIFVPKGDPWASKRQQLKALLLEECIGGDRQRIEAIIVELQSVNPTPDSAMSPLLQRKWLLEWTTEKEINFFIDWNLSGDIYQVIDGAVLENMIPFQKGGFLGVKGNLSTDGGVRTNFAFTEATLDLGRWGSFKIPPVGSGWFDTVYLDDELRVDTNSRNDILICKPII